MVSSNNDPSSTDRIYVILYLDPVFPFVINVNNIVLYFEIFLYLILVLSFFNLI